MWGFSKRCVFAVLMAIVFTMGLGSTAFAETRAFQASLTPEIAVHDRDVVIEGLSLQLWGENPQKALSLGLVSGSVGQSSGFSLSLLANYADSYKGVHWGGINYTRKDFLGWQSGLINYTDQRFKGVQTGFVNYARHLKGVQFGLINFAQTADAGVQLGLGNIIRENRWFKDFPDSVAPGMVFVNWRF